MADRQNSEQPEMLCIVGSVGEGLLGEVLSAESAAGERLAIKQLIHAFPSDTEQLRREFEILARLDHPNLNRYRRFRRAGPPIAVSESFIDGQNLLEYLRQEPSPEEIQTLATRSEPSHVEPSDEPDQRLVSEPASGEPSASADESGIAKTTEPRPDEASGEEAPPSASLDLLFLRLERLLPQIIAALDHLHRFKKAHGDLRPTNILVGADGNALITDYGLAPWLTLVDQVDEQRGLSPPPEHALRQKTAYEAPEAHNFGDASPAADLYALGAILYEAISGQVPFSGSVDAIRAAKRSRPPVSLSEVEPQCPATWVDLIHGLLDRRPEKRPSLEEARRLLAHSETQAVDIPPTAVPQQPYFVGRSDLLESLMLDAKGCAQSRWMSLTMLHGPVGVGKSTLAAGFAYLASQRGWLVVRGRCYSPDTLIYEGWREIAARLANICRNLPPEMRDETHPSRRAASALLPALRLEGDPQQPPSLDRLDAIAHLRSLIRRISRQRPLLIVLDDLHRASPDSRELLLDLLGDPRDVRCLVLGTWLDADQPDALPDRLANAPAVTRWRQVPIFSKDEARDYVVSLGVSLDLEDQRRILRRGRNHPLLLDELMHEATSEGERGAFSPTSSDEPLPDSPIERELIDAFESRIDETTRRESFVLQVLAVAQIPLPDALLSLLLDEEFHSDAPLSRSARPVLESLLEARLIRQVDSLRWGRAYILVHNLYRQQIRLGLREQRQAHLCRLLAEGIRTCWPSAEELRFAFLASAGQIRDAVDSCTRAARLAEARHAYCRAQRLWTWLADQPEGQSLGETQPDHESARLNFLAGNWRVASDLYTELAPTLRDPAQRASAHIKAFEANLHSGQIEAAMSSLGSSFAAFDERFKDRNLGAKLAALRNRSVANFRRWSDPRTRARDASASDDQLVRAQIHTAVLESQAVFEPNDAARVQDRLCLLAESSRDARLLGADRLYLAQARQRDEVSSQGSRIERWYDEAADLFARAEAWDFRARLELARARFWRLKGDFEQAHESCDRALHYFQRAPNPGPPYRFWLEYELGKLASARASHGEASYQAKKLLHFYRGDHLVALHAHELLASVALVRGRWADAQRSIDRQGTILAGAPASLAQVALAQQRTRLEVALGRPEVATGRLYMLLEDLFASSLRDHHRVLVETNLALAQALCAKAERERLLGEEQFRHSLAEIKKVLRQIAHRATKMDLRLRAEVHRLQARHAMLCDNPSRALRFVDQATNALREHLAPLELAKTLEARGLVLLALSHDDGRDLIDQARHVYRDVGAKFPLVLEGWAVPAEFAAIRRDPPLS